MSNQAATEIPVLKRAAFGALAVIATAFIPVLLYLGLAQAPQQQSARFAFWAPLAALAADAVLFYLALGILRLRAWDRVGISIVLPLLLAMASWALMMDSVSSQMPQGD